MPLRYQVHKYSLLDETRWMILDTVTHDCVQTFDNALDAYTTCGNMNYRRKIATGVIEDVNDFA